MAAAAETAETRFYGKYRATVVDNADPRRMARLVLRVPDVLAGTATPWALPCLPVTGPTRGVFVLPAVGADVWAEFEQGDPAYPIWVGGYWTSGDALPPAALGPPTFQNILLQTAAGNYVLLSDEPGPQGGIVLRGASGATITVNQTGIRIDNGAGATISLTGPTVDVNTGALSVT